LRRMSERKEVDIVAEIEREYTGAEFGDKRLGARQVLMGTLMMANPSASLPKIMLDLAGIEGTYRFLENKRVVHEKILLPHIKETVTRCGEQRSRPLAVFDTTELRFGGARDALGHLSHEASRGILAHVGLAVSSDGRREVLGTLHVEPYMRQGAMGRHSDGNGRPNEGLRWDRGARAVHQMLPDAVCVMDREADSFELLTSMAEREQYFVVRASQNRVTEEGKLWTLLDETELVAQREIVLNERRARKRAVERAKYPARSQHLAKLEVRARAVVIYEPDYTRHNKRAPNPRVLRVNLVRVIERDPPPGDEAMEWVLLTNLPVSNAAEIDFVVDAYHARWVIEEFFKALKSGCSIEKRQVEGFKSICNILALSMPIAWMLLRLRHRSRDEPDLPATDLLPPPMMQCLRLLYKKRRRKILPATPTNREVTWAIAALGGHIVNNGEPGFLVLGRGLDDLMKAAELLAALGAEARLTPDSVATLSGSPEIEPPEM